MISPLWQHTLVLWLVVLLLIFGGLLSHCAFAQNSFQCPPSGFFSFGRGWNGELGDGSSVMILTPEPIDTSGVLKGHNITAIVAGFGHALILTATGQVFSFGFNGDGQLGDGTNEQRTTPVAVDTSGVLSGKIITAVAAGGYHSLVLSSTGQVFSFGYNGYGQLGDGTIESRNTPVAVNTSGVLNGHIVTAIAAGDSHSLALSATGQVFSFGNNENGQLGDGTDTEKQTTPVAVDTSGDLNGKTIIAIAAGFAHSLVLSATGQVFSFGNNGDGQLGDGTIEQRTTPVAVDTSGDLNGKTITAIAAGSYHSLVLSATGQVFSFGWNEDGQLGNGTNTDSSIPVAVDTSGVLNGHNITAIAAGLYHSLVLSESGQVFSFGNNGAGQLGDGTQTSQGVPVAVLTPPTTTFVGLSGGSDFSFILSASGQAFAFGYDEDGRLGIAKFWIQNTAVSVSTSGVLNGIPISGIASGRSHTLALSVTGQVFSFGYNEYGQLGDGTNTNRNTPVAVNMTGVLDGLKVVAIAGGGYHSLVLSATGKMFSFGDNEYGQLGDGTNTDSPVPVAVDTSGVLNGTTITAIAAGGFHSLVLSATGQVFSFGYNENGELGNGDDTFTDQLSPVVVDTSGVLRGQKITAIAAGNRHSLVLSETAQVFSFGHNMYGQLGDGTTTESNVPVAVMLNGTNIVVIAAGDYHSLVLSATGKVFSFGNNENGQLGDVTTAFSNVPVAVNTSEMLKGAKITAIAAGYSHSLVLSEHGQVFSFGANWNGQLGDGTFTGSNVPVAVNTSGVLNGFDIIAISAGGDHSHLLSFSFSTITVAEVRDGRSINKQSNFQSETDRVAFNWDSFIGTFSNGQSQNVTAYNVTTIEESTGRIVLGPRIVQIPAVSEGPVLFFENQTDASLVHNMTYFTTINTALCDSASVSSNGFRVDTTPPQISEFNVDSELWSVGGNLTITWNGVIDLESGISEIEVSIIDAATNSTLPQSGCEMKSTTSTSSGEMKLTWSECGTQYPAATRLRAVMTVTNGAGLNTTRRSENDFQIAGVRITNLVNFDGSSHEVFQACRRAVMEWTSIGLENGTLMEISLVESASENIVLNITHEPVSVQRNQFEWEPVSGSVSAGQYRIKFQVLTPIDPAPIVLSKTITISAADACITITSPNTTSKWRAGTEQKIEWTKFGATLSGFIVLELLKDDEFISDFGNSISVSDGSITWNIPTDMAPSNRYRIRASSSSLQGVMFTTDPFEIVQSEFSSSSSHASFSTHSSQMSSSTHTSENSEVFSSNNSHTSVGSSAVLSDVSSSPHLESSKTTPAILIAVIFAFLFL